VEAVLFAAMLGGTIMFALVGGSMMQVREAELRVREAELKLESAKYANGSASG
jgi:hypothetical protein